MSEIVKHKGPTMSEQMEFARIVTTAPEERGAGLSILPDNYKKNPGNVLIAVGLGASMGLSPAESLYRIAVIKGKPSASAELIASNVRKAGHKLRIRVTEEPPSATCTIVRSDDPDEPITVTRDMAWATRMGLHTEPNYKKQPATMLSYRAITAAARLACPEALYGVAYTPDELIESQPMEAAPAKRGGLAAAMAKGDSVTAVDDTPTEPAELAEEAAAEAEIEDAEIVEDGELLDTKSDLSKAMWAAIRSNGITDVEARPWISGQLGREITSTSQMTKAEAHQILDHLENLEGGQS